MLGRSHVDERFPSPQGVASSTVTPAATTMPADGWRRRWSSPVLADIVVVAIVVVLRQDLPAPAPTASLQSPPHRLTSRRRCLPRDQSRRWC
jgi:hypothetical protein